MNSTSISRPPWCDDIDRERDRLDRERYVRETEYLVDADRRERGYKRFWIIAIGGGALLVTAIMVIFFPEVYFQP